MWPQVCNNFARAKISNISPVTILKVSIGNIPREFHCTGLRPLCMEAGVVFWNVFQC